MLFCGQLSLGGGRLRIVRRSQVRRNRHVNHGILPSRHWILHGFLLRSKCSNGQLCNVTLITSGESICDFQRFGQRGNSPLFILMELWRRRGWDRPDNNSYVYDGSRVQPDFNNYRHIQPTPDRYENKTSHCNITSIRLFPIQRWRNRRRARRIGNEHYHGHVEHWYF